MLLSGIKSYELTKIRYEISHFMLKNIFTRSLRSLVKEKRNFVYPRGHVISSISQTH